MGDLVCLAEPRGDGFVLSRQLLELAGPLGWGGNRWRLQAFVAHLVTHFDQALERFMCPQDDGGFAPSPDYCQMWAQRYQKEFLGLSPEWYRQLAVAKLLTLRVPVELVLDAKLAWFRQNADVGVVVRGLRDLQLLHFPPVDGGRVAALTAVGSFDPADAWGVLEAEARRLLAEGRVSQEHLCRLLDCRSLAQYERCFGK